MGTSVNPYLAAGQTLAGAASGAAQGQQQATAQKENYTLQKRQTADSELTQADQLARQTQTNPLRDQTIYQLAGILGAAPSAFNPVSFLSPTNTGTQGTGGTNLNALAARAAQYTPGAGGVTSNVQQMGLNRLGYGNTGTGTLFDGPTTPADQLSNTPGAASTTGAAQEGGGGTAAGVASPPNYTAMLQGIASGKNVGVPTSSPASGAGAAPAAPPIPLPGLSAYTPTSSSGTATGSATGAPGSTPPPLTLPATSTPTVGSGSGSAAPSGSTMSPQIMTMMQRLGMLGGGPSLGAS